MGEHPAGPTYSAMGAAGRGLLADTLRVFATFVLTVALAACTSDRAHRPHPTSTPASGQPSVTWSPTTGVIVTGRARAPRDITEPGIQVSPPNRIPIDVDDANYEIAANDWNTIVATSHVPRDIIVDIDPAFAASPTTRTRFQYLADVIAKHTGTALTIVSIDASADTEHHQVVTVAAIVNRSATAVKITRLDLTVTIGPPYVRETAGTFFDRAGAHLSVGARTVSFIRLTSPLLTNQLSGAQTKYHFRTDSVSCAGAACGP